MVRFGSVCALVCVLCAGCTETPPADAGVRDAGVRDSGPALPSWPRSLPAQTETRRGRRLARSILHVHSPLSHDACDGEGWADGELRDEACLAHFREALCALHIDAAMITDHVPHLDEVELDFGLWIAGDDEAVRNATGEVVASRMACPDGHRVLLTPGSENRLMPVMLERHPGEPGNLESMRAAYEDNTEASRAALRAAGALIWQAHTEGQTVEALRDSDLDGLELYNLHANVAPNIREDDLGLDPASYVADLLAFTRPNTRMPPDLAVLSFLEANRPALDRWDTLLAEGREIAGSGGCDAHENTFPMALADGERADSYRRMMYWIQNVLLVDDLTREGMREALDRGRFYVTTPALGRPVGFDFRAERADEVFEMGERVAVGATLRVERPELGPEFPSSPPPRVQLHLIRSADGGGEEVASAAEGPLTFTADEPGAYRVEVRMTPEHARPHLGRQADTLVREVVWIYSNPIFVE